MRPESKREWDRRHREEHRDEVNARRREWYSQHAEAERLRSSRYYAANRDEIKRRRVERSLDAR